MVRLGGHRGASLVVARTHDGRRSPWAHATQGVQHTEGLRGLVPALGVATLVGRTPWFVCQWPASLDPQPKRFDLRLRRRLVRHDTVGDFVLGAERAAGQPNLGLA